MEKVNKIARKFYRALWTLAALLLVFITLAIVFEVVMRYAFKHSYEWVGEYSGYLFVCIAFMTAPHAYSIGGLTAVDAITSKLQPRAKLWVSLLIYVFTFVFLSILLWKTYMLMSTSYKFNFLSAKTTKTPLWIPQLAMPVGSLLLLVQNIIFIVETVLKIAKKGE